MNMRPLRNARLTVEPIAGLGNRLRVLASGIALARQLDRPLHLIWTRTPDLGCRFGDLFQAPSGVTVHESRWTTSRARRLLGRTLRRYDRYLAQDEIEQLLRSRFDFRELGLYRAPFVITCTRFFPAHGVLPALRPTHSLADQIERGAAGLTPRTVGVHIRRGDNRLSIQGSPTAAFLERMRAELARDPRTDFFLATDSPAEEARVAEAFPGRVAMLARPLDRSRPEAIRAALVDLFCLARTRMVLGSRWSSFSEAAAEIGGIPLSVVDVG